ncbi:MAG: ABC transporter ATP-binding protein [Methanobrevibacter sp.]|jgi:putative ABC transport system ATP-binding protein|nr:ABC transporter ATP-binding protein [Methanobrevibacter sp.]
MTIIEFKNVTKEYITGEHVLRAADNLNFTIEKGEFVVILGPSGAGKSTLLNLLGGLDSPTSGDIIVNGTNIVELTDDELSDYRAKEVGFIFQFYNLIPTLNALENVQLIQEIVDDGIDADIVLESVGLENHLKQFPSQLSGGEQQRVSIARALSKKPAMLLCDEPTGALDSETGLKILLTLQQMVLENNSTVIIVTHNATIADAANKVLRIKNGKIDSIEINPNPKNVKELEL